MRYPDLTPGPRRDKRIVPQFTVYWSTRSVLANTQQFIAFVQMMANRLINGFHRYGDPQVSKKYYTRALMELREYKRTGNGEHLVNAANYCHLEMCAPENAKYHMDVFRESVTRGRA